MIGIQSELVMLQKRKMNTEVMCVAFMMSLFQRDQQMKLQSYL